MIDRKTWKPLHGARRWAAVCAMSLIGQSMPAAVPSVSVAPYGTTKDGRAVKAYTLTNNRGASAVILDYGATVAAINVPDRAGRIGNTVMSFADLAGWESLGHANAIIGRVANRLTNGYVLQGVRHPLPQQNAAGMTMHSGPTRYSTRVWTAAPAKAHDGATVTLLLESPDGDQGFPGHVSVRATYRLTEANALRMDIVATTDKPTIVNFTNHIYFNLNGNGTTPASDMEMQVLTDRAAELDPAKGIEQSIAGTPFDFRRLTRIATRLAIAQGPAFDAADKAPPLPAGMARSFNEPYWLRNGDNRLDRVAARLHDPASGRLLELRTTEPSVHVYTPSGVRGGYLSDGGKPFTRVPGIALEAQHLPESANRPDFPSTELRPGQTFRSTTIYAFKVDTSK